MSNHSTDGIAIADRSRESLEHNYTGTLATGKSGLSSFFKSVCSSLFAKQSMEM
jgi:hypothetical protein